MEENEREYVYWGERNPEAYRKFGYDLYKQGGRYYVVNWHSVYWYLSEDEPKEISFEEAKLLANK